MKALRRTNRARKHLRGVTLLEVAIATSLLVAFGGAAILATETAGKSFRTETVTANLESAARRTIRKITERLRTADTSQVTPVGISVPDSTNWMDFRRGVGYDEALEQIDWSDPERFIFEYDPGDPDDGVDNDGDGLIDEGRIVHIQNPNLAGERRVVLCNSVTEDLEDEIPGNLLDDNGNGLVDEPGFCVVFDGNRATIRFTLAQLDKQGYLIDHTFEKSIALRNTQTP